MTLQKREPAGEPFLASGIYRALKFTKDVILEFVAIRQ